MFVFFSCECVTLFLHFLFSNTRYLLTSKLLNGVGQKGFWCCCSLVVVCRCCQTTREIKQKYDIDDCQMSFKTFNTNSKGEVHPVKHVLYLLLPTTSSFSCTHGRLV